MALFALERVSAVLRPLRHRVIRTRVHFSGIIILWLLGICSGGLMTLPIYYKEVNRTYFTITAGSFLLISSMVICASYLTIRTRLRYTPPGLDVHNRQSTKHNLRLSRTFFIVVVLSLVFWLPSTAVYTIREFCPACFSLTWKWILKPLQLANSMVNPFVCSFRMPLFKDALKRFLRKRR